MKYVIIIPDGAADLPIEELDDRTPLEAARMPHLAKLAAAGKVGAAVTTPPGFEAGSDVCSMSLLGYSPEKYHTGRAPLEAAALGLELAATDWIFRLNLVTTGAPGTEDEGLMLDHSAGAISDAEARLLVRDLVAMWQQKAPELMKGVSVTPGVSYRNILVDSSGRKYADVATTPPHAIPREPWKDHLPQGSQAEAAALRRLMELSGEFLPKHEVNLARREQGLRPATMAWLWGQGTKPAVPNFKQRFGLRGAMITSVDLLAGIAAYIGWERLQVPGLTSYHDTDYAAQGRATVAAINGFDVVCCHVEAPDEMSHQGDWKTKVASLEAIDEHIVGPVAAALEERGDPEKDPHAEGWRLLVMPDHFTLCSTRKHDGTPVPFLMAGAWVRSVVQRPFSEAAGTASDLVINPGHELMEYFLRGGLANVRGR
ncbi:MAG: cofactor-independent phosphoglycerate mutase [Phycisphaerales bacterium]